MEAITLSDDKPLDPAPKPKQTHNAKDKWYRFYTCTSTQCTPLLQPPLPQRERERKRGERGGGGEKGREKETETASERVYRYQEVSPLPYTKYLWYMLIVKVETLCMDRKYSCIVRYRVEYAQEGNLEEKKTLTHKRYNIQYVIYCTANERFLSRNQDTEYT